MKLFDVLHHPRLGYVLLRVVLGILILMHGIAKVRNGIGFVEGLVTSQGLPAIFAYGVYIGEVVAPLLLILGILVAPAALVVAFNMVVALMLAHGKQLLDVGKTGGLALELQYLFLFTAIAVALLAPRGGKG